METLTRHDFFWCYDYELFKYLRFTRKIDYICKGRRVDTHMIFWQFQRTDELHAALRDYSELQIKT